MVREHPLVDATAPTLAIPLAVAKVAGPAVANTWFGSSLLPATLAYTTVKGVGWYDWGNSGLNDHEMKMNQTGENKDKDTH